MKENGQGISDNKNGHSAHYDLDVLNVYIFRRQVEEAVNFLLKAGCSFWLLRGLSNKIIDSSLGCESNGHKSPFDEGLLKTLNSSETQTAAVDYIAGGIIGSALIGEGSAMEMVRDCAPKIGLSTKETIHEIGKKRELFLSLPLADGCRFGFV